jgi:DUF971 family protein
MNAPTLLRVDAAARVLTVAWADGRTQRVAHARLRAACPCAECTARRRAGNRVDVAPDVTLLDIEPIGYGIRLLFSDGHARGLYPWPYLARVTDAQAETAPGLDG